MTIYQLRPATEQIVVHCSATPPSADADAASIRKRNMDSGFLDIIYHYVIKRDGAVEIGRPDDMIGAAVNGHNHDTIHICLAGGLAEGGDPNKGPFEVNYEDAQWVALWCIIAGLKVTYPDIEVVGHNDLDPSTTQPGFDVRGWCRRMDVTAPFTTERTVPQVAAAMLSETAEFLLDG